MSSPLLTKGYTTSGTVNAYRIVKLASDTTVSQGAAATDALMGVSTNASAITTGLPIDIMVNGVANVTYGGVVARGALLTSDANGKAVTASEDNRVIGIALVAGNDTEIGSCLIGATGRLDDASTNTTTVTITTGQLLALNATPKTLVAAPGANKAVILVGATLMLDFNSVAYDGVAAGEDLEIRYTDGSGQLVATIETDPFLTSAADAVRYVYPASTAAITPVANAALVMNLASAEIATGNSPLKVKVEYKIIDMVL